jgi:hypothetical protein
MKRAIAAALFSVSLTVLAVSVVVFIASTPPAMASGTP